jgi:hypothetical protein
VEKAAGVQAACTMSVEFVPEPAWMPHFLAAACSDVICFIPSSQLAPLEPSEKAHRTCRELDRCFTVRERQVSCYDRRSISSREWRRAAHAALTALALTVSVNNSPPRAANGMLIAYLPKEKILFTVDFNVPAAAQPSRGPSRHFPNC